MTDLTHPLQQAVLDQIGDDDARQIAIDAGNNGANAGWSGFTYYSDTCAFASQHRTAIAACVSEMAEEMGEGVIEFVRGFNCLDDETPDQAIAAALWGTCGDDDDVMQVENALAWFALEEVGRALDND